MVRYPTHFLLSFLVFTFCITSVSQAQKDDEAPTVSFGSSEDETKQVKSEHAEHLRQLSSKIAGIIKPVIVEVYPASASTTIARSKRAAEEVDRVLRVQPELTPLTPPVRKENVSDRAEPPVGTYLFGEEPVQMEVWLSSRGSGFYLSLEDCRKTEFDLKHEITYSMARSQRFPTPDWTKLSDVVVRAEKSPVCSASSNLDDKYKKIEHGNHYHYVPHNRDKDVPVSRFPTKPPGEGEYIAPNGEVVEEENQ